jgi:hypothetical protein
LAKQATYLVLSDIFLGVPDIQAANPRQKCILKYTKLHRGRENTDTNLNQERRVSTKQSSYKQRHTIFIELD